MNAAKLEAGARVWSQWGPALVVLALLCLVIGGWMLDHAAPETPNLFDKRWEGTVRTQWDTGEARMATGLFGVAVALSVLGMLLHTVVDRRRVDASVWFLLVVGAGGTLALFYALTTAPVG
jgi:hypothetical protein